MAWLAGLVLGIGTLVACGATPAPSGPGTSTLDVLGRRGECHSFGGCGWVARLTGPAGALEAEFVASPEGPDLTLGPGFPPALRNGDYVFTFEQRLLSDDIADGVRDFHVSATCAVAITVPGGLSITHVRVTFEQGSCSISNSREQVE
jgi:hypothetical protein